MMEEDNFIEELKKDIIPRISVMIKKEKDHLNWLVDNHAPQEWVEESMKYLNHYKLRHKEYLDYSVNNSNQGTNT